MGSCPDAEGGGDSKGKAVHRSRETGERKAREMDIIVEIGRLISSTLEIEEVYDRFAVEVRKLIPFDRININLKDPDGETFTIAYVAGVVDIPGRRAGDRIPLAGSITEEVLRTRAGLFLHPASEEEIGGRFPSASAVTTFHAGMRSIIAVPLISRDEAIGALHFRSREPNLYSGQDLILAERIGRQIAGAIANAGLFAHLERLAEEMAVIAEIGRLIGSTLDIEDVYKQVAALVRRHIPVDWLSVNLIDPDKETLTITYTDGDDIPGRRPGDLFAFAGSITEAVARKRAGLRLHPASAEEMGRLYPGSDAITFHAGMRSIMAVPLISQDELIGAFHFRAKRPNAYTKQDLRLAERIGSQIAGAVANARLFKQLQKAEASLRESGARFRAIFEQAAVGVAELDIATGRFLTVNWRLCELVGRTEEELMAATFLQITHPDDRALHLEGMALLTAGKVLNFTLEKRYLRKDGEIVWVSITLSPLWREGEPLSRNIIVVQDITERRRIGEELDRHAKRLVALNETGVELASELKLNALLHSIAERALALIGGNYCNCYLYRPEADRLERVAIAGEAIYAGTPIRLPGEGFVGHVWSTRAPFIVDDYLAWPGRMREFDFEPPRTLLGMPIRWGDQYRGVLVLMARLPHRYTQADAEVLGMFSTQAAIAIRNVQLYDQMNREISERRQAEEALKTTLDHLESRVRERTIELEETNTALRVLIKKGDEDQKNMEENLQSNIGQLVTPFLFKLRESQTDQERQTYLNILETNLNHIVSPFIHRLSASYKSLTPKEIQIAELVKQGKMSKEIAKLFGLSVGTVITHRNNIRKKLNLKSRDANLRSHLLSLV